MSVNSTGPYLCLRGGGASTARKEARKRKFHHLAAPGTAARVKKSTQDHGSTSELYTLKSTSDTDMHSGVSKSKPTTAADFRGEAGPHPDNSKHPRFVVFIGNLPFTATDESIQRHFACLKPTSIRHRYEKANGKSRGFAFLEFHNYDHMKTCLRRFHQSAFDDGISPARNLNVELTAGGGGCKSKDRRTKLKAKNERLRQERQRRTLDQDTSKEDRTESHKDGNTSQAVTASKDEGDIHPSRRARMSSKK
ncbi:MAG: hypothetical protein Q9207_008455 [Kuettlingeria erythrocarpa]